jgi:glycosyltransferase involved in cell wall biosynthesis
MPEVSIVISTHNRSALLAHALRSALVQRTVDFEVLVINNGSTDGTADLLETFNDSRLRVLRNERSLGATGGRNTGLEVATGTFVAILDDDDIWAPDKLHTQLDALEATGGTTPHAWAVSDGELPTGLTLDTGTGEIAGTPEVADNFTFTVEVTDSKLSRLHE